MMKLLLTTTIFFYFTFTTLAQEELTSINGLVTSNSLAIENVHIINLNNGFGEITDINGNFTIQIKKNDIIKISHIEYQSQKITISDEIIKVGLVIKLKRAVNRLNDVIIKNNDLTGNIIIDFQNTINDNIAKKYNLIEEIISLTKLPSKYDDAINLESPYLDDVNPIKIVFRISIRDKENELRRELREAKNIPRLIIYDLGKYFFINKLKIPEEKIHNFLTYCNYRNIFELYKKKKIMRVIKILEIESVSYHKKSK
jgi:hypothetical protein|tara:strand:+ start:2323 stop:3093 length:771 start_codon:yes stop_codon:yes gene_type:complete